MISKNILKRLLADTESHCVERTSSTDNYDKFCQAICAFANDISGDGKKGYLILGVYDNGNLSGLKVSDKLMLQISSIRTDGNILPPPVMTIEKFGFKGGDVLVAEVQPSEFPPVRYRGRVWVRVGPRKSIATEAEEKILIERRLSNVHTFDAMPCLGTSITDLDISLIKKDYLPKAVPEDVLAEDCRPLKEQLASLGFYDLRYDCPTNGAIILFGERPELYLHGSYVQYVRFSGNDRTGDIIHEHKFSGNLCKELSKIDTFIETGIAQKRPIPVSVLREETVSKYPYWATRELLMNAIMHRDYKTNAPVQFYEYDNMIEVQNPGGLYGKVKPDNFPNVSDYRNPFIAEAMKILGYVNRFSRGIFRVQKELEENGNGKAQFDLFLGTAFRVVENVSQKYFELGFGEETSSVTTKTVSWKGTDRGTEKGTDRDTEKGTDRGTDRDTEKGTGRGTDKDTEKGTDSITNNQQMILDNIIKNPYITSDELSRIVGIRSDKIRVNISKLKGKGLIKRIGASRGGYWLVSKYFHHN